MHIKVIGDPKLPLSVSVWHVCILKTIICFVCTHEFHLFLSFSVLVELCQEQFSSFFPQIRLELAEKRWHHAIFSLHR